MHSESAAAGGAKTPVKPMRSDNRDTASIKAFRILSILQEEVMLVPELPISPRPGLCTYFCSASLDPERTPSLYALARFSSMYVGTQNSAANAVAPHHSAVAVRCRRRLSDQLKAI